jgi:tRNA G18 (ribose-2'-O)-methylase SpoU
MTAGDLCIDAFLIELGSRFRVLTDSLGYPLQFDFNGAAARTSLFTAQDKRLILKNCIAACALLLAARLLATRRRRAGRNSPLPTEGKVMGCQFRSLRLISAELSRCKNLNIIEDDIEQPRFDSQFDVLRAANILNLNYFPPDQLRRMVLSLKSRIRPNGLFVVCRTLDDNRNHGTIFRLNATAQLMVVDRIGGGSEVESLILNA